MSTPEHKPAPGDGEIWRDPAQPADKRVADLLARMTLEEKAGQLGSTWIGASGDGDGVAPMQDQFDDQDLPSFDEQVKTGLGQLTRVFGTRPVDAAAGMSALAALQARVTAAGRFAIPAVAHEECLTGFAAWGATIFPTPLAWGASFDPDLVGEMSAAIGATMRAVGVHQGLAPVLDVTRDYRWGRTEETIGEDPYLVGTIGTAYVAGLQRAGVQATLKHFAAYASSKAARNQAPVSMGPRELADVVLVPFEMALRLGKARSVMPSYVDVDGVPASADPALLTTLLRDRYGFDGLVVSDYYAISFLMMQHKVAGTQGEAAALALAAGMDVELPAARCFGEPLLEAAAAGQVPESLVDRAAARVLRQKLDLGLLDPDWTPQADQAPQVPDLDPPHMRDIARRLAQESVILVANGGGHQGPVLPLAAGAKVALVGPLAGDELAFFGCYSMPRHLGNVQRFDGSSGGAGVAVTTLADALAAEGLQVTAHVPGCEVRGEDTSGFAAAVSAAADADAVVAVVGDVAGLFGRGTSGEGCDATELRLPGVQEELLHALAATGRPVVAVLVTGRPYALGGVAGELAAVVQAFFPGEEGGTAVAGVLSGRVNPSGKLPVEIPREAGSVPATYLRPANASRHEGSATDPTPLFAFGHGLSYTDFAYSDLELSADTVATDAAVEVSCTVTNTGDRAGTEVVQLYLGDPVASVVRPARWLAGFARTELAPGQSARVTFSLHADRTSFTGRDLARIVEPGAVTVAVGGSSDDLPLSGRFTLSGPVRTLGIDRVLETPVCVAKLQVRQQVRHGRTDMEVAGMAQIRLDHVEKVYNGGVKALDDLNLEIADGEFMVLIGPSGCGKSTALRSIAGLEEITGGTISMGSRVLNNLPPKDRDIAMVFQNYALYPHMTVADNLAFGLKLRHTPKAEITRRVNEAATLLGLEPYLGRKPAALSGGQRQRVAMGRAIVREPAAFLMDEPLSNLDAKLRVSMRAALNQLHDRLGTTTVYVTHDQVEAMTLGQRVCVLRDGQLQQADTPQTLFDSPVNLFVAGFIGSPAMNFATAQLVRDDGPAVVFAGYRLPVPAAVVAAKPGLDTYFGREVIVGVRPSDFEDGAFAEAAWPRIHVTAEVTESLGTEIHAIFTVDAPRVEHHSITTATGGDDADDETVAALTGGKSLWTARVSSRSAIRPGGSLQLAVDTSRMHFFDPVSGDSIGLRLQDAVPAA